MNNKRINPSSVDAINYYGSMTSYIERLRKLHSSLRKLIKYGDRLFKFFLRPSSYYNSFVFQLKSTSIRDEVQKLLTEASDKEAIGIAILVTVVIVSPIIIILVRNVVATIQVCCTITIDDDKSLWIQISFQALFYESCGESEGIKTGTKEKWRTSVPNASHERGDSIKANWKGSCWIFSISDCN